MSGAILGLLMGNTPLAFSQTAHSSAEKPGAVAPARTAQQPVPPPDWRGASVSADTARMSPGHQDFRRYDPEQCLRAVLHIRSHLYRHNERDSLQFTPEGDTLPTIAIDTGRACSARFHNASVPVHQLGSLIRLQLAVSEDDQAAETAERWLAMDLSLDDRRRALRTIAMAYIEASPLRLDAARAIIARIDSLGIQMSDLRMAVHAALAKQWYRQFNTAEMRKEGEAILSIAEHAVGIPLTDPQRLIDAAEAISSGFRVYAAALAYEEGRAALKPLIERSVKAAFPIVDSIGMVPLMVSIGTERGRDARIGMPFPPIYADWVIPGGSAPQPPRAGRVTLVVPMLAREWSVGWNGLRDPKGYALSAVLRRLAERYGPHGLDVVIVTQTKGYSFGSLVQTEDEELESIEDLYLNFLKIPATILVKKTSFQKLPDGRFRSQPDPFLTEVGNTLSIIGRDGRIRWFTGPDDSLVDEAQIEAYVKAAIAERNG